MIAAGIAASPGLLPRSGTTPGVYEARKSLGWAVLVAGIVLLTLPAVAVYLRAMLLEQVVGQPRRRLPAWFQLCSRRASPASTPRPRSSSCRTSASSAMPSLFALPIAAGFRRLSSTWRWPAHWRHALAALACSLVAMATMLAEDVVHGLPNETAAEVRPHGPPAWPCSGRRFVTIWLAVAAPADPLELFLWAFTLTASAAFPVLRAFDLVEAASTPGVRWPG